jgi:transcriptional regulator with XRE-family HTH domain
MSYDVDFETATSTQIEAALCARLADIRLARNLTQARLAAEAGVSLRTIGRLEQGEGTSLDTFLRVLIALRVQQNLAGLLPDPSVRPVERVGLGGRERRRARPRSASGSREPWTWGDEPGDDRDGGSGDG